jgi:RNA-binding motif protein, X-linked 2
LLDPAINSDSDQVSHEVSIPVRNNLTFSVVREIDRINQKQLDLPEGASWYLVQFNQTDNRHDDFKDSAYIFVGGIPYELTEGDVICVFSQFGEILDINLVRDRETGKSKGFAFLKYDDQRSTVLAVDNFNGASLLGRTLRVDHSRDYRQAKKRRKEGEESESSEEELDEDGKPRVKGFNVAPKGWLDPPIEESEESEDDLGEGIDPDDPMRDYLIEKRRQERLEATGKEKKHRSKRHSKDKDKRRRHHHHKSEHKRIKNE